MTTKKLDIRSLLGGLSVGVISASIAYTLWNKFHRKESKEIPPPKQSKKYEGADLDEQKKLMTQHLERNIQFFGRENQDKIGKTYAIVVGVGSAGSHCVIALARSGLGKLKLIDHGKLSVSSLARNALAMRSDVGTSKVACCQKYLAKVTPICDVTSFDCRLTKENIEVLIDKNADYVIDCMDDIESKVLLAAFCVKNKIKIISSCGAGSHVDPTWLQIRDIDDVKYDQVGMALKDGLRKVGVSRHVLVICSDEKTQNVKDPLKTPTVSTYPAIIGLAISAYMLSSIGGTPIKPMKKEDVLSSNFERMYNGLLDAEKARGVNDVQLSYRNFSIIARQVFGMRCVITNKKHQALELVRWDPSKPATADNVVIMSHEFAKLHSKLTDLSQGNYDAALRTQIGVLHQRALEVLA